MGKRGFDISRYHIKRTHPTTGLRIVMYKDDPGAYWDMKGGEVTEVDAAGAGFDVELYKKERLRKSMLEEKEAEVNAYMRDLDEKIDAKVEASVVKPETKEEPTVPPPTTPFEAQEPVEVVGSNVKDKPRETQRRKMTGGQAGRWQVIDKATGKPVHGESYLDTQAAEAVLLEKA